MSKHQFAPLKEPANIPKHRRPRTREHLRLDEVNKLLAASKDPKNSRNPERDYCLLFLMYRHGLRVTEACQLKLSDVNLARKVIFIRRLKNGLSSEHPIYNGGELKALQDWMKIRVAMDSDHDTLFLSERRQPLSRMTVWKLLQKYAQAAELDALAIHPHMLRHAVGYDLANRNKNLRVIQNYLGHRYVQHTVKYTALADNQFAGLF
jgi:type 1 fimbriae regulatory protein FimB